MDIMEDPYVQSLQAQEGDEALRQLQKAIKSHKTYCFDQLKHLTQTASQLDQELGSWASDFYIYWCVTKYQASRTQDRGIGGIEDQEAMFLLERFAQLNLPSPMREEDLDLDSVSPKVRALLNILTNEMTSGSAAIVFVRTRAAVSLLSVLLAIHPSTKTSLKVGTFVGTSNSHVRKSRIGDWVPASNQENILDELRHGVKNVIVSTSVLEEGIDVTACNVVICFEPPLNLKSFIQRRGRARDKASKYIIMLSEDSSDCVFDWQGMEENMKKMYADSTRELQKLEALESLEHGYRELQISSSG